METQWNEFIDNYIKKDREKYAKSDFSIPVTKQLANGIEITIRLETEKDIKEVEELTKRAFWKRKRMKEICGAGCDEHYLCHTLRTSPEFVPELDFVAETEIDGEKIIVGNVMSSMGYIENGSVELRPVLNYGPLSILPEFQNTGVGGTLMTRSIQIAKKFGYGGILFFGHPNYYPRFGLKEAVVFGITTSWGKNFPAFMGMELIDGYLSGFGGKYHESPLMAVNPVAAKKYDTKFPHIPLTPEIVSASEIHLSFIANLLAGNKPTTVREWLDSAVDTEKTANFIIYSESQPAGYLQLSLCGDNTIYVSKLIICPERKNENLESFALSFAKNYASDNSKDLKLGD